MLGQRIARKEIIGSDLSADRQANTEYYVHDGVNIVADLDENKELLRSYTYTPGYDNIISMTTYGDSETNTYFYIRSHNNSVVALVDEAGSVAESYEYGAYGKVTVFDSVGNELDKSALGNRYTFQGREIDWSTGLCNFRARWYSSETGRWLSKDPIGINGGLNQYVFCGNNPVMFVDPEGLDFDEFLYEQWEFTKLYFSRIFEGSYMGHGEAIILNVKLIEIKKILKVQATLKTGYLLGTQVTSNGLEPYCGFYDIFCDSETNIDFLMFRIFEWSDREMQFFEKASIGEYSISLKDLKNLDISSSVTSAGPNPMSFYPCIGYNIEVHWVQVFNFSW